MKLTSCPLCQTSVSPLAVICPNCAHPQPVQKQKPKSMLQMDVKMPPGFYVLSFMCSGMAALFAGFFGVIIWSRAASPLHEIVGATTLVAAAVCGLISIVSAVALDNET